MSDRAGIWFGSVVSAVILAVVLPAGAAVTHTINVNSGGAIADETTSNFSFTVGAGQGGAILDVKLVLAMDHTYPADLTVRLSSPNSTRTVELFADTNPTNIDQLTNVEYRDITFTSASNWPRFGSSGSNTAPYAATYRVQDAGIGDGDMDVFNGLEAQGTWTLTIIDAGAGDTGTLYAPGASAPWGAAAGTKLLITVPEPAAVGFLIVGAGLLVMRARRRRVA